MSSIVKARTVAFGRQPRGVPKLVIFSSITHFRQYLNFSEGIKPSLLVYKYRFWPCTVVFESIFFVQLIPSNFLYFPL